MGLFQRLFGRSFNRHEFQFINIGGKFSFNRGNLDHLIDCSYLSNPELYAIVKKLSDVGSSIPMKLRQIDSNGEKVEVENSELLELIKNPNNQQTTQEFFEQAIIYLALTGNLYIKKTVAIGFQEASEMEVLNSSGVEINLNSKNEVISYTYTVGGTQATYQPEEIIHVKFLDPSLYGVETGLGLSPVQAAMLTIDASNNSFVADSHLLKNKGMSGILSTSGEVQLSEEQGKMIQDKYQRQIAGGGNFGKIVVAPVDMKYIQTGMSPTDLKLVEMNVQRLRTMCNVFGFDSSLFNDPANKTYNNRSEAEKAMYSNAILPILNKILIALNKELITEENTFIEVDISSISALQKDKMTEARRLSILVKDGIYTVDEAREELGKKPLGELNNE